MEVFLVFNGTGANCLSLEALTKSYHAVICAALAHIYTDECGAPEKFTGCKLIPIPTPMANSPSNWSATPTTASATSTTYNPR